MNPQPFLQVLLRLHTYGRKQPFLESWVLILTGRYLTRALILDIQRLGGAGSSAVRTSQVQRTSTFFDTYVVRRGILFDSGTLGLGSPFGFTRCAGCS